MSIINKPMCIKNTELRNRLVMPPMVTAKAENDGKVTERLCDYYAEKSSGISVKQ